MVPIPGRKGATVQVASSGEPVAVVPMPFPQFRLAELTQPVATEPEVIQVAVAAANLPDPQAVAAQLEQPVFVASVDQGPIPAERPMDIGLQPAVQAANVMGGAAAVQQDRPLDVIGAWLSETFSLGAEPAPLGQTKPSAPLLPPVGIGEEGQAIDPTTSGSVSVQPEAVAIQQAPAPIVEVASVEAAVPQPKGWVVQIGAAPTEQGANSLISSASGSINELGSFQPYVERFVKNGQVFFRARFAGFGGRDDATAMCNELKKAKMSCLAMQS
jgi:D-alanyl-D-alanine carboxypeptidase